MGSRGTAGGPWPAFDLHSPICSLPLVFPRSLDAIPSATPYLPPVEQSRVRAWEDRLGPRDKFRIGLVWSGNPAHDNDHNRSIPLRMFADLLDLNATFVSLNKDPSESDEPALRAGRVVDWTAQLTDFAETAALVTCLDLVITVDQRRPSGGCVGTADLDSPALHARLSLAARGRQQPLVSNGEIVQAGREPRLCERAEARAR